MITARSGGAPGTGLGPAPASGQIKPGTRLPAGQAPGGDQPELRVFFEIALSRPLLTASSQNGHTLRIHDHQRAACLPRSPDDELMARRRLDHVDPMRPVKQAGVLSTHTVLYLAPAAASLSSGAALLLLHVSREGFFFISACMLTYAYGSLGRAGLGRFYWRRFLSVGIPYLCWTLVYFLYQLPMAH